MKQAYSWDTLSQSIWIIKAKSLSTGRSHQGNLVERLQGIQDTIESEYPDISILDVQSGYADPAKVLKFWRL